MRAIWLSCAAITVALAMVPPADARDIYVNNALGDDRSRGERLDPGETGPVRTIGRALYLALPGDRIVLANTGKPYHESVTLTGSRHSGSGAGPFVIDGNGAILDGSAPVPPAAWEHYRGVMFRFRPPHTEFQQLLLDGKPLPQVPVDARAADPPRLDPLQWCMHRGMIYFGVHPTKLPDNYPLSYAHHQVGITLFHVRQVVIQDLVVQHFQTDGINAFNSAREVTLLRVVSRGNGRAGIAVGGASLASVDHCLLGNNGAAQLLSLPYSETHVHQGELLANTAPGWVHAGGKAFFDGTPREGGLNEYPAPAKQP
ncbi:MAG: hypothetical protein NUV77_10510 [Thermoguttaceae bacterium]|jgi:hypothetical protein|nr:hypothetical protein [Thermoguttaceae bacterium]